MTRASPTRFERCLSWLAPVHAGEGSAVFILFLQAFALMLAYYLIRPVREALILTQGGAEFRSYAVAVQALLLVLVIPAYGAWVRRIEARRIYLLVNAFFVSHLLLFCLASLAGWRIGFAFFVWGSLFSVMAVTQFWAFATDLFSINSGERLFGLIAVGVSAGAVAGAQLSAALFDAIGPHGLMLASAAALSIVSTRRSSPRTGRSHTRQRQLKVNPLRASAWTSTPSCTPSSCEDAFRYAFPFGSRSML